MTVRAELGVASFLIPKVFIYKMTSKLEKIIIIIMKILLLNVGVSEGRCGSQTESIKYACGCCCCNLQRRQTPNNTSLP
jgi:hypothetical protein